MQALNADIAQLRTVDVTALDATRQVNMAEALITATHQLNALTASVLAAAHTSDATVVECGRATRSWLVEEQYLGPHDASNRMRLAHGLPSAPAAQAAFSDGAISDDHALIIVRTLTKIPEDMREVVDKAMTELAREMPPHQLAAAVDEILARLGVETSEEERFRRRYERRGVNLDTTFAGFGSLAGTLTPEAAETLRLALAAAGAPTGPDDDRDAGQRRHDALAEIATRYLETETKLPDTNGERPRIVVTMDLDTLLGRL